MAARKDLIARLERHLKDLRLPTMRDCFADEAERARKNAASHEAFLAELVEREVDDRRQRRIERFLHESRLPLEKNMETFEMDRIPAKARSQVSVLLEGSFLERTDNVLCFGNPGSGKSHLLSAIAQELVHGEHRILFTTCALLVQELLIAKRDLKLKGKLKSLDRFDAVLISMLAHRYERGSVMITSNLPFSGWETIFKDPMTTAAAIDRLVHHSVILELNIPSYRLEHAGGSSKKKPGKHKEEK
jgi:DNA replication protein DnaC